MESNWATEHLQTIRTLMERSALYRRALAPIMIFNGLLGTAAAVAAFAIGIDSARGFVVYWAVIALLAVAGSLLLVRRQAIKESEPFWSPPTRRVTQALLPPLVAGAMLSGLTLLILNSSGSLTNAVAMLWLPAAWVILYGCAFHAAGFFMPRGMRLFGWIFIVGGCGLLSPGLPDWPAKLKFAHGIMGFFFGLLHLAYGIYLYFTEKRRDET